MSEIERAVAVVSQFNADAPAAELAKKIGTRVHNVHYALNSLLDRKILKPWLAINHFALGFEQFDVFFSLSGGNAKERNKLLSILANEERVLWYVELGGGFQYAFCLYADSVAHAATYLESLAERSKVVLVRKQIAAVVFFSLFRKKLLLGKSSALGKGKIEFKRPDRLSEIDELDKRLLAALYDFAGASHVQIARALGIPRSTVDLRVKRLGEKGVLLAHIYHVSTFRLGIQSYKVLIFARGIRPELREKLLQYAENSLYAVNFGCCFGNWDYELGIEVNDPKETALITAELYDRFGSEIDQIQVLPVFERNVSKKFMRK